jgi:phosphoenolpyruvate carboxykinase (ATP)
MKLKHTRAIIDAIHDGSLAGAPTVEDPIFGLSIPTKCPNVPARQGVEYERTAKKLANLFHENFKKYADQASNEILKAGPRL